MYLNIEEALAVLQSRRNMVLGIDHFKALLETINNPQNKLKCIHIGGTNGKGSTTNYVRAILESAGYKVGTFTSPHLIAHNDRIRINNVPISDDKLLHYINESFGLWDKHNLSMFEMDMLISIQYFIDEAVDYVVYEVGLGGRLDATNVITPIVSAITNVDYDHMNILGNTLEKIAFEKAGIIKEGVPLLTTEVKDAVRFVFEDICEKRKAPYIQVKVPQYTGYYHFIHEGVEVDLVDQGIYQVENASLAISIVKWLNLDIDNLKIKEAIEKTHWQGRFEKVAPSIYIDGAHNIKGVQKLVQSLASLPKPWIIVFSALGDKDHDEMVHILNENADTLIVSEFDFYRAESAEILAHDTGAMVIKDYKEAIQKGIALKENGSLIVTGSLYFISDARAYLLQLKGIS